MAQDFNILATTNIIKNDVARHNENYATLRSSFSGATFPTSPTTGQTCWRTDRKKKYTFTGDTNDGENGWVTADDTSAYIPEIIAARGSKNTLDQRLDIALNEDGTLKDNVTGTFSEWQESAGTTYTYLTGATFKTNGNTTDIFLAERRLKCNLVSSFFYTEVVSSSYNGTFDETTVTIKDSNLDNTLVNVNFGIVTPFNLENGGSLKINRWIDDSILITPPSDADYTLTEKENLYGRIEIDTTNWTTARNIIMNNDEHTFLAVVNNTGSQNATFKTSAGAGVLVNSNTAKQLRNNTVNVIEYEEIKSSGKLLQRVYVEDGTYGTGTTILPNDNTIPQQTEGNEIITASITPISDTSRLLITASVFCGETTNVTSSLAGALFRDSASNAISSMITVSDTAGSSIVQGQVIVMADVPSTSTSLTTFKLRAGLASAGTLFWNGLQGLGAVHGGTMKATITILEVEA